MSLILYLEEREKSFSSWLSGLKASLTPRMVRRGEKASGMRYRCIQHDIWNPDGHDPFLGASHLAGAYIESTSCRSSTALNLPGRDHCGVNECECLLEGQVHGLPLCDGRAAGGRGWIEG